MKLHLHVVAFIFAIRGVTLAQNTPSTMPPDSWLSVPNTKMSSVTPAYGQFPGTWSIVGPGSVVSAWCGAALDTQRSRLIVFGGGHADYAGNELYVFDISTMTWSRLTDPFVNPASDDSDFNPDGTPQSRHTYGGLAYLAQVDRFFALGGAISLSGHAACTKVWTFDFGTNIWTRDANQPPFVPRYDCSCVYDPATQKLWFCENDLGNWAHLWSYDFNSKAWASLPIGTDRAYAGVALDTKRGLLVALCNGGVVAYDVRGSTPGQIWQTTGPILPGGEVGFEYDPVSDKYVGWSGGPVYVLDPSSKAWTVNNPAGAPSPSPNGTFGRWRYVPSVNAFILLTDSGIDVHFYKMPSGSGTPPPPPQPPPGPGGGTTPPPGPGGSGSGGGGSKGGGGCGLLGMETVALLGILCLPRRGVQNSAGSGRS